MAALTTAVPSLVWLRAYDRRWLRADLIGGVTAGAVVIPQAMAYATIADLPVQVGLYTCMVPMAVYAFLGGSRTLSVSTTSTVATLTASTLIAVGVAGQSRDPAGDLAMLTLLVGAILLFFRLCRLGALIDNISEATLVGIKAGVGLTVAAGQLPKLLGIPSDPTATNFFDDLRVVADGIGDLSVTTTAFSIATITGLLLLGRLLPKVPAPLVAVVAGITLVAFASLDEHGVALIAPVPSELPSFQTPSFDHLSLMTSWAIAIALMCFLETASVARNVRRPSEPPIDNDQELAANGVSCVAGALFQAMPSAGGFSQTAINQRAGARTQLSELVTVVLAIGCALFLAGVLSDLPEATLGCLVMVAVLGLIKPAEFVRFWQLNRFEFWVAVATAVSGLLLGLLAAVAIGVVLTLVIVIVELDRVGLTELQPVRGREDLEPAGPTTEPMSGLLVLRFDGPLYTANIRSANRRIVAAVDAADPRPQLVVVDATAVGLLTVTVMDEFRQIEHELLTRDVELWIAALSPRSLETARKSPRWAEMEGAGRLHPTALAAVQRFRAR